MKRLLKDRKILYFVLCMMLILVFSLTVVYSALNSILQITGSAEVAAANWDIRLENPKVMNGSVNNNLPVITNGTTASFSAILNNPGEFYEFTIDVVNSGSIDAMIDSVTKAPTLTADQAKYLNYIVEYQNGESINTKQLVEANSFVRLKVKVEFRKDLVASDLPTSSETLNLSFRINYVQSDDSSSGVINNGVEKVKPIADGDINDIGTIVTIGTEKFYVIGTDDNNNIKLFSMMNIKLYDDMLQSSESGVTAFSKNSIKYAGSYVEEDVNNYKNILERDFGVEILEARSISYDELVDKDTFACAKNDYCSDKYPWIYSTSYWTGSGEYSTYVWAMNNDGSFFYSDYFLSYVYGVRPVIVISKDYFN